MCGRLACTLGRKELQLACGQACRRRSRGRRAVKKEEPGESPGRKVKEEPGVKADVVEKEDADEEVSWLDQEADNLEYKVNHNVSPTQAVPCLLRRDGHALITPMLWGFVPAGHKGSATDHGLSTFNARAEGLQTSPLYRHAFKTGKRCAVLCTGFFEWKTIDGKKQPFFFHLPQEKGVCVDEPHPELSGEYHGPRVTPLAGVYHDWENAKGQRVPNVTIVTMGAGKWVSWCHHRMPLVLDTPEKLEKWLDGSVDPSEAAKMFVEPEVINWYPVKREFYSAKPDHPLKPFHVDTDQLVPVFVTDWNPREGEGKVEPPEVGKHKQTLKRARSESGPDSPVKKQSSLSKWFVKKEKN